MAKIHQEFHVTLRLIADGPKSLTEKMIAKAVENCLGKILSSQPMQNRTIECSAVVTDVIEQRESEYSKYLRTGVKSDIWPPISMTREELDHFRSTHGIASN